MSESKLRAENIEGLTEAGYRKLIEEAKLDVPSFEGKLNIYVCELLEHLPPSRQNRFMSQRQGCGSMVVTRDVDHGVTPAFILCTTCGGHKTMASSFYRVTNQAAREGSQWYRPTFEEFQKLGPAGKQFVLNGGLMLRDYKAE